MKGEGPVPLCTEKRGRPMATILRRSDYLSGACTHREYYGQFVTEYILTQLMERMPQKRWAESTCEHFNDIPLHWWDRVSIIAAEADAKFTACGDYPTLAGRVCILKEAARQVRDKEKTNVQDD